MTARPKPVIRHPAESDDTDFLLGIQHEVFRYFIHEVDDDTGLVLDRTETGSPASIAGVGLALACYVVGAERGYITRHAAIERTLRTLRFLCAARQSDAPDATGHRGFFYHFLDPRSGRRAPGSELSTIDTSLLIAGALTSAAYFTRNNSDEREIRGRASTLHRRVDWRWACNGDETVAKAWTPERGFGGHTWTGYSEALILYALALGSPTHGLPARSYRSWCRTYQWRRVYDTEFLWAGPLFIHQLSHAWIDFRGITDAFMRRHHSDYFENSRRATVIQQGYAMRNSLGFAGYGANCWGITASDGPGPAVRRWRGRSQRFYDYIARGVPYGPDDGTLAPWAVTASLPFAPEIVLPTLRYFHDLRLRDGNPYGFKATFNRSFPVRKGKRPWVSPAHYALNEGPMVLMIENHLSGLVWRLMRSVPAIRTGLMRAGFTGGWLDAKPRAQATRHSGAVAGRSGTRKVARKSSKAIGQR